MAVCKLGHVYVVPTTLTNPPKDKFAVCVAIDEGFFIWINSSPRKHGLDQMPVAANSHPLVKHDSFLDVSRVVAHPPWERAKAQEHAVISKALRDDIVAFIEKGLEKMSPRQSALLVGNLLKLY